MNAAARRIGAAAWGLILPLALLAGWWIGSVADAGMYFPPLPDILRAFAHTWFGEGFVAHVVPSLRNFAVGYLIASAAGIVIGVAIGRIAWLHWLLGPLIEYARSLPPPALLPFFILVLGIGPEMQVGIIAFGVFFVVLLNTIDGARGIEPTLLEVSAVYRIPRWYRLTRVILPAASPQIVAGLHTGTSLAVILMVVSEMVAATRGIGFFTLQAQQNFAFVDMWSGMLLLAIIGVAVNLLFERVVERPILFWQRGVAGSK